MLRLRLRKAAGVGIAVRVSRRILTVVVGINQQLGKLVYEKTEFLFCKHFDDIFGIGKQYCPPARKSRRERINRFSFERMEDSAIQHKGAKEQRFATSRGLSRFFG